MESLRSRSSTNRPFSYAHLCSRSTAREVQVRSMSFTETLPPNKVIVRSHHVSAQWKLVRQQYAMSARDSAPLLCKHAASEVCICLRTAFTHSSFQPAVPGRRRQQWDVWSRDRPCSLLADIVCRRCPADRYDRRLPMWRRSVACI